MKTLFQVRLTCLLLLLVLGGQSCKHKRKENLSYNDNQNREVFINACDSGKNYHKIALRNLIDSLEYYNGKYVEVTGLYKLGFEESALYVPEHISKEMSLWVDFDERCELYLSGTKEKFFSSTKNQERMNGKFVKLHGFIDRNSTGHLGQYKAGIERVSFVLIPN